MTDSVQQSLDASALLVYYSAGARLRLQSALQRAGLQLHPVDGRAADAVDQIRSSSGELVVIDAGAVDLNVRQAIRHIGQISPNSHVMTSHPDRDTVEIYRNGRRIGVEHSLEQALRGRLNPATIGPE